MPAKSVLVTGAAGFIGSHLTEHCLALGFRVIAIDGFTDNYSESLKRANIADAISHPDCELIDGDLLSLDVGSLLDDVSIVFHLAAQPGVRQSWDDFERYVRLNLLVTQRLLNAASRVTLDRFIVASSSSVYGDTDTLPANEAATPRPLSPYGVTKVATEQLARAYWRGFGIPTVALRYFTVYGPRQRPDMAFNRLIASALSEAVFDVFGDGSQTRDFTFVSDAVTATIAAAQSGKPGTAYNIAGGSRQSLNSVIDLLSEMTGTEVKRRYIRRQRGDARDTAADISRAQTDLGFSPAYQLEAGLRAQLEWHRRMLAPR
jgi:nucleoside-diphosphate-sugar epimerase